MLPKKKFGKTDPKGNTSLIRTGRNEIWSAASLMVFQGSFFFFGGLVICLKETQPSSCWRCPCLQACLLPAPGTDTWSVCLPGGRGGGSTAGRPQVRGDTEREEGLPGEKILLPNTRFSSSRGGTSNMFSMTWELARKLWYTLETFLPCLSQGGINSTRWMEFLRGFTRLAH